MTDFPKVTIGIPTYNQAQLLIECIESVIIQDYPNLEIIILDDTSSDETPTIAANYQEIYHNIKYFRNIENIGRIATYHKLLYELATGEWYLNLDGDDILISSSAISTLINALQKERESLFIMGNAIPFSQKNNISFDTTLANFSLKTYEGKDYFLEKSPHAPFNHAACLYSRKSALENNFYTQDCFNTDFISIIQLCFFGKIMIIDAPIAGWRVHENNATHNVSNAKDSNEIKAYYHLAQLANRIWGEAPAKQWLDTMLSNSEKYRIRYVIENQGITSAFFSLFNKNIRLTSALNWSDFLRFFYYSFKKR